VPRDRGEMIQEAIFLRLLARWRQVEMRSWEEWEIR
jgi:hypothetical protein